MNPSLPPLQAGMLASGHLHESDESGKHHYQATVVSSALEARFEATMARLGDLDALQPQAGLLIALAARELVLTPSSVRRAADSYSRLYQHAEFVALEWELPGGWRDRRFLSGTSLKLLGRLSAPPVFAIRDWQTATALLGDILDDVPRRQLWPHFCACASAWWSFRLPTLLWAHACGAEPLQPLSRATWARHLTGLPLLATANPVTLEEGATQAAFFATTGQSRQTTSLAALDAVVRSAAAACRSRAAFAQRVISEAKALLPEAAREGRIQVLLVGFLIDLIENGGVRGTLSLAALQDYSGQTIRRLFDALVRSTRNLNSLEAWDWWKLYQSVIENARESQRGKVRATLHAFHDFLHWLGVPELPRGLGDREPRRPPRAEVLWPLEGERAIEWLRMVASANDRANDQAQVVVHILLVIMVRVDEVLGLRVGDVLATAAGVTLLIYPRIADGEMKAGEVRRPVDVESPEAIDALRQWTHRRVAIDLAGPNDFLFGAPRSRKTKFEHGRTYALVQMAFKVASGVADLSSHAARHRKGSQDAAATCMPHRASVDINPLDQLSAAAGQGLTQSLRETYINIFEEPLRAHAECMCRPKEDAVPIPEWIPQIDSTIAMDSTGRWRTVTLAPQRSTVDLDQVLAAMEDLGNDMTTESVASRTGLPIAIVERLLLAAAKAFQSLLPEKDRTSLETDSAAQRLTVMSQLHLIVATRSEKWKALRAWINAAPMNPSSLRILETALTEWRPLLKDAHLSVAKPELARHLIQMIRASGIASDRILITHAIPREKLPKELLTSGWHLRREASVRRGQPKVRLHICSTSATSASAIDRAISNKGLFGLLVAAEVRKDVVLAWREECRKGVSASYKFPSTFPWTAKILASWQLAAPASSATSPAFVYQRPFTGYPFG